MKKKLLLLITLGISFTPLAFADGQGEHAKLSDYTVGSTECSLRDKLKKDTAEAEKTAAASPAKATKAD